MTAGTVGPDPDRENVRTALIGAVIGSLVTSVVTAVLGLLARRFLGW